MPEPQMYNFPRQLRACSQQVLCGRTRASLIALPLLRRAGRQGKDEIGMVRVG